MITDMHCHFVPDAFLRFVEQRDEFAVKVERAEGEDVSLRIRGTVFDLNTTFFKLDRQVARLYRLGIDRTILSLATPFIDYHLEARLAIDGALSGPVWLVLRPEVVGVAPGPEGPLVGTVADVAFRGTGFTYRIDVAGLADAVKAEVAGGSPLEVGSTVSLRIDPASCLLLPREP